MPKKGAKLPYRVKFRYEHGLAYPEGHDPLRDEPVGMTRTGPPVQATHVYGDAETADSHARGISQRGGRAEVIHVHPDTGARCTVRVYEPHEVSAEDPGGGTAGDDGEGRDD